MDAYDSFLPRWDSPAPWRKRIKGQDLSGDEA